MEILSKRHANCFGWVGTTLSCTDPIFHRSRMRGAPALCAYMRPRLIFSAQLRNCYFLHVLNPLILWQIFTVSVWTRLNPASWDWKDGSVEGWKIRFHTSSILCSERLSIPTLMENRWIFNGEQIRLYSQLFYNSIGGRLKRERILFSVFSTSGRAISLRSNFCLPGKSQRMTPTRMAAVP